MPAAPISQSTSAFCLSCSVISSPRHRSGTDATRATSAAMLAATRRSAATSNTPGRHAMESASSSGYSNTSLKMRGAMSAADSPPSAPPNDIHR